MTRIYYPHVTKYRIRQIENLQPLVDWYSTNKVNSLNNKELEIIGAIVYKYEAKADEVRGNL